MGFTYRGMQDSDCLLSPFCFPSLHSWVLTRWAYVSEKVASGFGYILGFSKMSATYIKACNGHKHIGLHSWVFLEACATTLECIDKPYLKMVTFLGFTKVHKGFMIRPVGSRTVTFSGFYHKLFLKRPYSELHMLHSYNIQLHSWVFLRGVCN